jgi:hypothetical protein
MSRPESAVTIAEKDIQTGAAQGRKIGGAITVKVSHGDELGRRKRIALRWLERAVTIAEEDTDYIDKIFGLSG